MAMLFEQFLSHGTKKAILLDDASSTAIMHFAERDIRFNLRKDSDASYI